MNPIDGTTLHGAFERVATSARARVAVIDESAAHTYGELDAAADRLAGQLRAAGTGPGDRVAVCAHRDAGFVIAMLAVLKADACYVPLDPALPASRRQSMLDDAACRVVLTRAACAAGCRYAATKQLDIDAEGPDPATTVAGPGEWRPAGAAYVIFTSGSSGRPKGVEVSHGNVLALFAATRDLFDLRTDDNWLVFHSFGFDFSVWELWGALLHGATAVIATEHVRRDPDAVVRLVRDRQITVLSHTPTAFAHFARAMAGAGWPSTALRWCVFGGEALTPASLRDWVRAYGTEAPRLMNMYGITETTVHVTSQVVSARMVESASSVIGAALPGWDLHLLDNEMRPVPPGAPGELYVGGRGVALGYVNRPDLTASRFVPDPFTAAPGGRLYRSGDLATRNPDGSLVFLGRADSQVKVSGYRIELGEIEAVLRECLPDREVAAAAKPYAADNALLGYLTGDPLSGDEEWRLRASMAEVLPTYMIPTRFVAIAELPLTANGKLDRDRLPNPLVRAEEAGAAATVDMEGQLRAIVGRVFGRTEVEPGDDFFALGGNSMSALNLVAQAREQGVALTVQLVYQHPTVSELAQALAVVADTGDDSDPRTEPELTTVDPERLPAGVETAYPMSALQTGMVYESLLGDDPAVYHDLVTARFTGPLRADLLERVLESVSRRHEVLRATFDFAEYSEPVQLVWRDRLIPLAVHDRIADRDAVRRWWSAARGRAFDFDRGPLVCCDVFDHGGEFDIALSAHHSILDGWSFASLICEIVCRYDALLGGGRMPEPPAVRSYREFVQWERETARSAKSRAFWAGQDTGVAALPRDPASCAEAGQDSIPVAEVALPKAIVDAATLLAQRNRVAHKSVLLAAHLLALAELTGDVAPTTGLVVNGRSEWGSNDDLGLFINSVPLRVRADGDLATVAARAHAAEQELLPHRAFPLALIQHEVGRMPFEVLFNYADFRQLDALKRLRHLRLSDWWTSDHTAIPFVAEVVRSPLSGCWTLSVRLDRRAFGTPLARRYTESFLEVMRTGGDGHAT
jgi:amino acid adenylation domain-containing protein